MSEKEISQILKLFKANNYVISHKDNALIIYSEKKRLIILYNSKEYWNYHGLIFHRKCKNVIWNKSPIGKVYIFNIEFIRKVIRLKKIKKIKEL